MKRALKEYVYYLKSNKGLSKNTIDAYETDILAYLDFLEKNYNVTKPRHLESEHIKKYLAKLVRDGVAKSSERRKLSAINNFNNYLLSEGEVTQDQISKPASPKKEKRIPVVLTEAEVNQLLDMCKGDTMLDKRNLAMFELMYGSGLRISELVGLNLDMLHINNYLVNIFGKGSKERIVPLNPETIKALKDYILNYRLQFRPKDSKAVFLNSKGDRISRQAVFKIIKELALKAGINKEISPHTMRHSFATHLLEGGADIMVVKELLGHEDVQTTEFYTHVSKKTIFDKYDEILNEGDE